MLGDTAVAVNPDDPRYRKYHGATLSLPVLGRPIPVITDAYVALDFGTGALKITPAHDFNDFEMARATISLGQVIDEAGPQVTAAAGKYQGMDRFACRAQILKDLKADGLPGSRSSRTPCQVGHRYRCKTVVEPLISKQWFVAVKAAGGGRPWGRWKTAAPG